MKIDEQKDNVGPEHVGHRIYVLGIGWGLLRYYGLHARKPGMRCGVELDSDNGKNNGSIDGYWYFSCPERHGLLVSSALCFYSPKNRLKDSCTQLTFLVVQCDPRKVKTCETSPSRPFIAKVSHDGLGEIDPTPYTSNGKSIRQAQTEFLKLVLEQAAADYNAVNKEKTTRTYQSSSSYKAKNRFVNQATT